MKINQSDDQLIEQFLSGDREEVERAFERLVTRHGPLVLGVCRHVLRHQHDAEDAFQATFLALARQAASIQNRRVLAGWLHEVAYRHALRLRAQAARRSWLPGLDAEKSTPEDAQSNAVRNEIPQILRAEIDRLPIKYRTLVVRCYLEGKSNEEVARLLGCPVGTVKGRLWRARGMLRERLQKRGVLVPDRLSEIDSEQGSHRIARDPSGSRSPQVWFLGSPDETGVMTSQASA
jgi:RNA polymerase sigma-70 factor (ECF subfamily)